MDELKEKIFLKLLKQNKLPAPEKEHRFNPNRRWRFDYAFIKYKIAIEVEGGVWIRGRHSRGKGMIADMEKYNWAVVNGWRVLRYTPQSLLNSIQDIQALLLTSKEE